MTSPTPRDWKTLPITEKQQTAIFNMRYALGLKGDVLHKCPETRGDASKEITRLREIIVNNLSIGGSINPSRGVYSDNPAEDYYD